jgi:hypothetical protein
MNELKAIRVLHGILKHRNKWYIDPICPDIDEFKEICEKAKLIADKELNQMSVLSLFCQYRKWRKTDPIVPPKEEYYDCFLNWVLYEIGKKSLVGRELYLFEENCFLSIKFI